jgi:hypothetical protein
MMMSVLAIAVLIGGCGQAVTVQTEAAAALGMDLGKLERFDVAGTGVPLQAAGALRAKAHQAASQYIAMKGPGVQLVDVAELGDAERARPLAVEQLTALQFKRKGLVQDEVDPQFVAIVDVTHFERPYLVHHYHSGLVSRADMGPDGRRQMPEPDTMPTSAERRSLHVVAVGVYVYDPASARSGPLRFTYQATAVAMDEYGIDEAVIVPQLVEHCVKQFPEATTGTVTSTMYVKAPR